MTDDEKISQRYRELGAEEPPRALDDAILAAARRGRQRWYAPLATAAVLVLAVAVTLHMQIEQPNLEAPARPQEKPAQPAAQPPAKAADDRVAKAAPESVRPKREAPAGRAEAGSFVPEPPPQPVPAAAAMAKRPEAQALSLAENPERELERIAGLRAQGRQDEADRALAEFRKRYPDYRIPEDMRVRVERR